MTPIRDIRGELAALREKEIELKAQHAEQLVRLLQETKADELDPTLLAGLLLSGPGHPRGMAAARGDALSPTPATTAQGSGHGS